MVVAFEIFFASTAMSNTCVGIGTGGEVVLVKSATGSARFRAVHGSEIKYPDWTSRFFPSCDLARSEVMIPADQTLYVELEGPLNHAGDFETCFRLFAHPNLFEHLTAVLKFVSVDQQSEGQLFAFPLMGGEYLFRITRVTASEEWGVSKIIIPSLWDTTDEKNLIKKSPLMLVHGVSPDWTPVSGNAWHALDLHVTAPSKTALLNIITHLKKSGIHELVVWGIDSIPSDHLICFSEIVNTLKDFRLVFVAASLSLVDAKFLDFVKPENIVAVEKKDNIVEETKAKQPVIVPDISLIPETAIATAQTYFLLPLLHPELVAPFAEVIPNIASPKVLICGGPQSGKSSLAKWMIAQIFSENNNVTVIEASASSLFSKYLGSSEKRVMNLFKKATIAAPAVILIEGIHSLCPSRDAQEDDGETGVGDTYNRMVATFLNCLDGVDTRDRRVAVIATSLLGPDKLDPAAVRPGRLETHILLGGGI